MTINKSENKRKRSNLKRREQVDELKKRKKVENKKQMPKSPREQTKRGQKSPRKKTKSVKGSQRGGRLRGVDTDCRYRGAIQTLNWVNSVEEYVKAEMDLSKMIAKHTYELRTFIDDQNGRFDTSDWEDYNEKSDLYKEREQPLKTIVNEKKSNMDTLSRVLSPTLELQNAVSKILEKVESIKHVNILREVESIKTNKHVKKEDLEIFEEEILENYKQNNAVMEAREAATPDALIRKAEDTKKVAENTKEVATNALQRRVMAAEEVALTARNKATALQSIANSATREADKESKFKYWTMMRLPHSAED